MMNESINVGIPLILDTLYFFSDVNLQINIGGNYEIVFHIT